MTEQRDGTGTGVWTHPAAVEQREQQEPKRCECGACGGRGHIERDGEIWMCATCNGTGHVPYEAPRCECRACRWDGMRWVLDVEYSYDYDGHEQRGTTAERVDTCPKTCGCRLSVVDGEPRVGEKYAVLERDARRFRAVAGAVGPMLNVPHDENRWHFETDGVRMRYETLGEYADTLLGCETDE